MSFKTILLFSSIIFFSCSKSKNTWLVGTWEVKQYLINGNDSTSVFLNDRCHESLLFLTENNNSSFGGSNFNDSCLTTGNYELNDENNQLSFGFFTCAWRVIGHWGRIDINQSYKITFLSPSYNEILMELSTDNIYEKIILIKTKK